MVCIDVVVFFLTADVKKIEIEEKPEITEVTDSAPASE